MNGNDLPTAQRIAAKHVIRDGESIGVFVNNVYPLIQHIDVTRCNYGSYGIMDDDDGKPDNAGILVDRYNNPVTYIFDNGKQNIDAGAVLHLRKISDAWVLRGLPWYSTVMSNIENFNELEGMVGQIGKTTSTTA